MNQTPSFAPAARHPLHGFRLPQFGNGYLAGGLHDALVDAPVPTLWMGDYPHPQQPATLTCLAVATPDPVALLAFLAACDAVLHPAEAASVRESYGTPTLHTPLPAEFYVVEGGQPLPKDWTVVVWPDVCFQRREVTP